jgi:hypothetical protein
MMLYKMGYLSLWHCVSSGVVGGDSLHVWKVAVNVLSEELQMALTLRVWVGVATFKLSP